MNECIRNPETLPDRDPLPLPIEVAKYQYCLPQIPIGYDKLGDSLPPFELIAKMLMRRSAHCQNSHITVILCSKR